jgi:hypothetical protein
MGWIAGYQDRQLLSLQELSIKALSHSCLQRRLKYLPSFDIQ